MTVERVNPHVGDGLANRHGRRGIEGRIVAMSHAADDGLCRAIFVVDRDAGGEQRKGGLHRSRREVLTAQDQAANPRCFVLQPLQQREVRRRQLQDIDVVALKDVDDREVIADVVGFVNDDASARHKRQEYRCQRQIDGGRRVERHGGTIDACRIDVLFRGPCHVIDDTAMLDDDTFGLARRT